MRDAAPVAPGRDAAPATPGRDGSLSPPDASPPHDRDATASDGAPVSPDPDGAPAIVPSILELPPLEAVPAPRADDCSFSGPTDLVPSNVFVPPAWEVEADGASIFFTARAQVGCLPVPPSCQQQGILQKVPRCGGTPITLGLPFNGSVSIRAGGGKVYVLSSKDGFFRVDPQTGAAEKMDIGMQCVADFAANATTLVVVDSCQERLLSAPHSGTALAPLYDVPSPYVVGVSAETAYVGTPTGMFWVRLDIKTSGKLTTGDWFTLHQIRPDARAVWTLMTSLDYKLRVVRLPLDGSPPDVFPSGALNGVPTITVADGYGYFLKFAPPDESGTLMRAPSAGGPAQTIATPVVYTDVAAYGTRAYFTEQGAVRTAR
jgi:hypothetical protein